MSAESVREGQIIGRSSGAFRNWQRRGCGSTPDKCRFSHNEEGILPGMLTYCDLQAPMEKPIQIVEETSGKLKAELVPEVYCGAGEEEIIISK